LLIDELVGVLERDSDAGYDEFLHLTAIFFDFGCKE
jgi:hypothetical protein